LEKFISVTDDNFRQNFVSYNYSVVPDSLIELIFSNKMTKKEFLVPTKPYPKLTVLNSYWNFPWIRQISTGPCSCFQKSHHYHSL